MIIPVFNCVDMTAQCLRALAETTAGVDYEVVVVDNASTDGTAELLAQLEGDVQIIRNAENRGFGPACNQGARAARGRHLVFLNNDTLPLPGWLAALLAEVESHSDVAIAGSKLLFADGTIQHAGVAFSRYLGLPYHLYYGCSSHLPMVNRRRELQCVTAACCLIRRDVFEQHGGFDEGYRNGFEDVDLCLRISEAGWKIVYQPSSVVYHLESQTPGRNTHDQGNAKRLLSRWGGKWSLVDQDLLYFEDGVGCALSFEPDKVGWQPFLLVDPDERRRWETVAEVQRSARRNDVDRVRHLVGRPDDWPREASVLRWAPTVCHAVGAPEHVPAFWERLLEIEEDVEARLLLAQFAAKQERPDDICRHVDHVLAAAPHHAEGWYLRAVAALQHGDWCGAQAAVEQARTHGAAPCRVDTVAGMAAIGLGDAERAWDRFRSAALAAPDPTEALDWLVRVGSALDRWQPLAAVLETLVAQRPEHVSARIELARVLLRLGRKEAARAVYAPLRGRGEAEDLARALDGSES